MRDQLKKIRDEALSRINSSRSAGDLESLKIIYLGRKSQLNSLLRNVKELPADQRPVFGQLANAVRQEIEKAIIHRLRQSSSESNQIIIDETLPGKDLSRGHYHPITLFMRKVNDIFSSMGFEIVDGPEVETTVVHFDQLNIPAEHPARDMWDTFYVSVGQKLKPAKSQLLLRAQTSSVQIRAMAKRKPPVRLIAPGRVYRHEATDASHEAQFHQCEGLVIDENVSLTDLIGTLKKFLQEIFGNEVKIRIRPEYYPFVEPGIDLDMSCRLCGGRGCSVCSQRGWLEMLGSGMVHPKVLQNMGINYKKYSGFAFGLGIDRLMMLYYGIKDIRLINSGDLRFISQF